MAARVPTAGWFALGCVLVALGQAVYLSVRNDDLTALLQVGPGSPTKEPIERELGPLYLAPTLGHDGKYFYLIARQPWFWRADDATLAGLQDPAYRFGRPLYPILAGLGGTLSPRDTLVGLIVVQILSGGLYLVAVAAIVRREALPSWTIALGAANPAVYSSAVILSSDLLALALVLSAFACRPRHRPAAIVLFALAALAKEYYLLAPVTLSASLLRHGHLRHAAALVLGPAAPLATWKLAVAAHFGPGGGGENFSLPGVGIVAALPEWRGAWPLAIAAILVLGLAFLVVARPRPSIPQWQCAAWGTLGLCASKLVWTDPADALRVLAPLWWFVVWAWTPIPGKRVGTVGLPRTGPSAPGCERVDHSPGPASR